MSPCICVPDEAYSLPSQVNLFVPWRASQDLVEVFEIVLFSCVLYPVYFIQPTTIVN